MVKNILKISLFVLAQLTNVTDRHADGQTDRHRMPAIAALMHSIARQKRDGFRLRGGAPGAPSPFAIPTCSKARNYITVL